MRDKETEIKIKTLIEPIVRSLNLRLFDVEFAPEKGWVLRIIIDKEGGVTINDCEELSKRVSPLLDVEDIIKKSYILEVSSPGLTRELKEIWHYEFFKGRLAKVFLREKIENKLEHTGIIKDVRDGILILEENEKDIHIPFSLINKGRLEISI